MPFKTDDRVFETSITTGAGDYTLDGAQVGFNPFSSMGANNLCPYFSTDDVNWEVGIGTILTGPARLQRTTILRSSNADAAVNWGAGSRKIRCGLPAAMAIPRILSKSVAGGANVTLTTDEQRRPVLEYTGLLTANIVINVDATPWQWIVYNNTTGAYTITFKVTGQTGVQIPQGVRAPMYCDGTDVRNGADGRLPPGAFLDFGGTAVPTGYLGCDGANVSRSTYGALFAAIGTIWGVGDGSTTFTLPDFRRRVAVGSGGTAVSGPANTVGATGGAETHTLTPAEIPAHAHGSAVRSDGGGGYSTGPNAAGPGPTDNAGGGGAHPNMQPSAVVLKIIKT